MKNTLIILAILFSALTLKAQKVVEPFASAELFSSNHITIRNIGIWDNFQYGDLSLKYGMRFNPFNDIMIFSISAQTYMNIDRIDRYKPKVAFYTVSAGHQFKNVFIKIEHLCIHPIRNPGFEITKELYGGYTKLGVYWNIKD